MVPAVHQSSTHVYHQHFTQWDPQVFMSVPIWEGVSFPPDSDITDSNICLFVAVLFFADKNMLVHCWMGS